MAMDHRPGQLCLTKALILIAGGVGRLPLLATSPAAYSAAYHRRSSACIPLHLRKKMLSLSSCHRPV
jgi:hypothetical protein